MTSVFDDPGDGSVLVAVERPPNFVRMTPEACKQYLDVAKPVWIRKVAAFLDSADDAALAQIKAAMVRKDLLK